MHRCVETHRNNAPIKSKKITGNGPSAGTECDAFRSKCHFAHPSVVNLIRCEDELNEFDFKLFADTKIFAGIRENRIHTERWRLIIGRQKSFERLQQTEISNELC